MTPEEEKEAERKEAERKEAERKEAERKEAEAEAARRAAPQDPPPKGGNDVTPAFLDEWTEYKTETGWMPKARRPAPVPKQACCILHPYCMCEKKSAAA